MFSMYSGCLVCIGNSILRFRGQNYEFCRSGTEEPRLSEKNLAQARFRQNRIKISLGISLKREISLGISLKHDESRSSEISQHSTILQENSWNAVVLTKFFPAVSYNFKKPLKVKLSLHITPKDIGKEMHKQHQEFQWRIAHEMLCYDRVWGSKIFFKQGK